MKVGKVWGDDFINTKKNQKSNIDEKKNDLNVSVKTTNIENIQLEKQDVINKINNISKKIKSKKASFHNLNPVRVKNLINEYNITGRLEDLKISVQKEILGTENKEAVINNNIQKKLNEFNIKFKE